MATTSDDEIKKLRSELDGLTKELGRLREQAGNVGRAAGGAAAAGAQEARHLAEHQIDEIEGALRKHPITSVLVALFVGLVLGRLTSR